jgi:hypothetical protein
MNRNGCGRKVSGPDFRYYPASYLEGFSRILGLEPNPEPAEYVPEMVTFLLPSVNFVQKVM